MDAVVHLVDPVGVEDAQSAEFLPNTLLADSSQILFHLDGRDSLVHRFAIDDSLKGATRVRNTPMPISPGRVQNLCCRQRALPKRGMRRGAVYVRSCLLWALSFCDRRAARGYDRSRNPVSHGSLDDGPSLGASAVTPVRSCAIGDTPNNECATENAKRRSVFYARALGCTSTTPCKKQTGTLWRPNGQKRRNR